MKLETVRKYALSLDDVTEEPHHHYSSFRVRGKIFVTIPPTEDVIHVFVDEEDRVRACALYPGWAEPLFWGSKATGVRITLKAAGAVAVKALVNLAYLNRAKRR